MVVSLLLTENVIILFVQVETVVFTITVSIVASLIKFCSTLILASAAPFSVVVDEECARPGHWFHVSALCCLQCYDIVDCVTRTSAGRNQGGASFP